MFIIFTVYNQKYNCYVPHTITDQPAAVLDILTDAVLFIGQRESTYSEFGEYIVGAEEKLRLIQNEYITHGLAERALNLKLVPIPPCQFIIDSIYKDPKGTVRAIYDEYTT